VEITNDVRSSAPSALLSVLDGFFHAGIRFLDLGDVLRGSALGREPNVRRLDHTMQFLQFAKEFACQSRLGAPDHHVRVEPIPLVRLQHACAQLRTRDDQPLGGERLDHFADHRAAHAKLLAQRPFGRDRRAGRVAPRDDLLAQQIQCVAVDVLDGHVQRNQSVER
jgi:hypothetical protein